MNGTLKMPSWDSQPIPAAATPDAAPKTSPPPAPQTPPPAASGAVNTVGV